MQSKWSSKCILIGASGVQERKLEGRADAYADANANAVVTGVEAGRKLLGSQPEMVEN